MGLEVWYPNDIKNAILAAEQASATALQAGRVGGDAYQGGYRDGYQAALLTIALAFGLVQPGHDGATLAGLLATGRR